MKKQFIIYTLIWLPLFTVAQDLHFSQFDASPLSLNPAYTGLIKEDYRFVENYRSQWSSVSSHPYSSSMASYDMNWLKHKERSGYIGTGLSFYNDKAGTPGFRTNQYAFSLSAIQPLAKHSLLSVGIQSSYNQRIFNADKLTWDNQYVNGSYDPNIGSGETSLKTTVNYFDISTGVVYQQEYKKNEIEIGGAYFNANQPNVGFDTYKDKLDGKFVFHGSFKLKLSEKVGFPDRFIMPKIIYMRQSGHNMLLLGAFYQYVIEGASRYTTYKNQVLFNMGVFYRLKDAVIVMTAFDYGKIRLGISYDVTLSKMHLANANKGAIEISLIYKGLFNTNLIRVK